MVSVEAKGRGASITFKVIKQVKSLRAILDSEFPKWTSSIQTAAGPKKQNDL